jgi:hypothetical protein
MYDGVDSPHRATRLATDTVPGLIADRVARTPNDAAWCVADSAGGWTTVNWTD